LLVLKKLILINNTNIKNINKYACLFYSTWYYYDTEIGLYYLNSRYYDPVVGRFINADTIDNTIENSDDLLSGNLFAYCTNNPVNHSDPDGTWKLPNWSALGKGFLKAAKVAIVIVAVAAIIVGTGGAGAAVLALGGSAAMAAAAMAASATAGVVALGTAAAYSAGVMVAGAFACGVGQSIQYMSTNNNRGNQKGNEFRGGSKKTRDNWYGYSDKNFQNWWHRIGKNEWGGSDIMDSRMAKKIFDYWTSIGKPKVK